MLSSTTSRLRHTFKYPSDDTTPDTSPSRDELDEQQQESLLTSLSTTASQHDSVYRMLFIALPLASMLPLIRNFFVSHGSGRAFAFPGVLGLTSLAITAWEMYRYNVPGNEGVFGMGRQSKRPSSIFASKTAVPVAAEGPLLTYLPHLNGTIAVLLVVLGFVFARREGSEGVWMLLLLPAVNLGVVVVVKRSMVEVERGLGELRGLRYEYKGA